MTDTVGQSVLTAPSTHQWGGATSEGLSISPVIAFCPDVSRSTGVGVCFTAVQATGVTHNMCTRRTCSRRCAMRWVHVDAPEPQWTLSFR